MFVLQTRLGMLNVPHTRAASVYRSGAGIQLALPDLPPQMANAYLVVLKGGGKAQVLVGLFMTQSHKNLIYVSEAGEVSLERLEEELDAGLEFAESMGFVLNDMEFERMSEAEQASFWKQLPICRRHAPEADAATPPAETSVTRAPAATSTKPAPQEKPAPPVRPAAPPRKVERFSLAPEMLPRNESAAKPAVSRPVEAATADGGVSPSAVREKTAVQTTDGMRPPRSKADIQELRRQLRERLGRFLASL